MGLAIIFTGQGNQDQDMFNSFGECYSTTDLECISEYLNIKVASTIELNNEQILANQYAQPLIAAHGFLIYQQLINQVSDKLVGLAGYSLGEVTAFSISLNLSLEEVLAITTKRAELMVTQQPSRLLYIKGLSLSILNDYLAKYNCYIAIINGADQIIIGGYLSDIMSLIDVLITIPGYQSHKLLGVQVASHTPLLANAGVEYQEYLLASNVINKSPNYKIVAGYNALIAYNTHDAVINLARQIHNTISFNKVIQVLHELGADTILEIGQGNALQKIVKNTNPTINVRSLDDFKDISQVIQWINKYTND